MFNRKKTKNKQKKTLLKFPSLVCSHTTIVFWCSFACIKACWPNFFNQVISFQQYWIHIKGTIDAKRLHLTVHWLNVQFMWSSCDFLSSYTYSHMQWVLTCMYMIVLSNFPHLPTHSHEVSNTLKIFDNFHGHWSYIVWNCLVIPVHIGHSLESNLQIPVKHFKKYNQFHMYIVMCLLCKRTFNSVTF